MSGLGYRLHHGYPPSDLNRALPGFDEQSLGFHQATTYEPGHSPDVAVAGYCDISAIQARPWKTFISIMHASAEVLKEWPVWRVTFRVGYSCNVSGSKSTDLTGCRPIKQKVAVLSPCLTLHRLAHQASRTMIWSHAIRSSKTYACPATI